MEIPQNDVILYINNFNEKLVIRESSENFFLESNTFHKIIASLK